MIRHFHVLFCRDSQIEPAARSSLAKRSCFKSSSLYFENFQNIFDVTIDVTAKWWYI